MEAGKVSQSQAWLTHGSFDAVYRRIRNGAIKCERLKQRPPFLSLNRYLSSFDWLSSLKCLSASNQINTEIGSEIVLGSFSN